jgi:transaldolase
MNREAKDIYKQSGYSMSVEVAEISISIAKLLKKDQIKINLTLEYTD